MDFSHVEGYLDAFVNYEVLPGFGFAEAGYDLRHVEELLRRLGDPHLGPRTIHVAGSKGKGSTASMVAGALSACGHVTGLYTSPHLVHLGERIQVNGVCASPDELLSSIEMASPHIEAMRSDSRWRRFTYFELLTVLAFLHFRCRGVQAQVVEVGLGGRLDATNVVKPDVCIITPISLEHTAVLGNTLAKIAAEKAGIVKPGAQVVCAPQPREAMDVIRSTCLARRAPLFCVGEDVSFDVASQSVDGQVLRVRDVHGERTVAISLAGSYQAENAVAAVMGLDALRARGMALVDECVAEGLARTRWPGRFQVLAHTPLLVLDGAHNPASMRRLADSLSRLRRTDDLVFVLGFSSDKDVEGAVSELRHLGGRLVLTRSSQPRAVEPRDLAMRLNGFGMELKCVTRPRVALQGARSMVGTDGTVVVAGSLYLVGEILGAWNEDMAADMHWESVPSAATRRAGH